MFSYGQSSKCADLVNSYLNSQNFLVKQTTVSCDSDAMELLAFSPEIPYDLHRYYILTVNFTEK